MKPLFKHALIAWAVLSVVLTLWFPPGNWAFAMFIAAIPVAVVVNALAKPRGAQRYQIKGADPFVPAFASDTIALDTENQKVWLWDVRGKRHIFERSQLAEWTHHWTISRNMWGHSFHRENRLEIRTRSLDTPTVVIAFARNRDWTGSNRNYQDAVEWKDRLSVFVNG